MKVSFQPVLNMNVPSKMSLYWVVSITSKFRLCIKEVTEIVDRGAHFGDTRCKLYVKQPLQCDIQWREVNFVQIW